MPRTCSTTLCNALEFRSYQQGRKTTLASRLRTPLLRIRVLDRNNPMFSLAQYSWTRFQRGAFDFLLLHEFTIDRRIRVNEAYVCHFQRNSIKYRNLNIDSKNFKQTLLWVKISPRYLFLYVNIMLIQI